MNWAAEAVQKQRKHKHKHKKRKQERERAGVSAHCPHIPLASSLRAPPSGRQLFLVRSLLGSCCRRGARRQAIDLTACGGRAGRQGKATSHKSKRGSREQPGAQAEVEAMPAPSSLPVVPPAAEEGKKKKRSKAKE